jgi:hypothetical protein
MYSRAEVQSCPVKASLFNFTVEFWVVFYQVDLCMNLTLGLV